MIVKKVQSVWNLADRPHSERIQHKVQKRLKKNTDKNFPELIEEEIAKELSIDPIEEG